MFGVTQNIIKYRSDFICVIIFMNSNSEKLFYIRNKEQNNQIRFR